MKWLEGTNMISIIIPVYNVENYLKECLDSVAKQTYTDFEAILVDDGSTDNSGAICDEYAQCDSRFKVFHKANNGLSSARNYGLDRTKGDYLVFVDSDDVLSYNALEMCLNTLMENNLDAVFSPLKQFWDKTPYDCSPIENASYQILDTEACIKRMLMSDGIGHEAQAKLYKAYLWKDRRFPIGKLYEDLLTTYYLVEKINRIAILETPVYLYRQRQASIMHSAVGEREIELLYTAEKVTTDIESCHPKLHIACRRLDSINYLKLLQRILFQDPNIYKKEQNYIIQKNKIDAKCLLSSKEVRFVDKVKIVSLLVGKPLFILAYKFGRGMQ